MRQETPGRARTTGRRPGPDSTRAEILRAASAAFATTGFNETSVRAIAATAGVDPSTVLHFFGSKDGLFRAVISDVALATRPFAAALQQQASGRELVRLYLAMWEGEAGSAIRAMIRSSIASERAVHLLRASLEHNILQAIPSTDALGAELAAAHLMGIALGRYIAELPQLAQADIDTIASRVGPILDTYL
ncbi:TetR family transcriptional regulator [Streptosporangium subroseum]|uniref:TetR/AcrR family transcriptional regulator n=1 Tax=Streptosporangium subroseum TaxID=106412 RepID=UPI0034387A10